MYNEVATIVHGYFTLPCWGGASESKELKGFPRSKTLDMSFCIVKSVVHYPLNNPTVKVFVGVGYPHTGGELEGALERGTIAYHICIYIVYHIFLEKIDVMSLPHLL